MFAYCLELWVVVQHQDFEWQRPACMEPVAAWLTWIEPATGNEQFVTWERSGKQWLKLKRR